MDEMHNVDWSALHTVEEMRQLSNLGHWIEGGLFGLELLLCFKLAEQ